MSNLRQREPRERNEAYLRYVRTLPCTTCGKSAPSQAAHVRYSDAASGTTNPGVGAKPDDSKSLPLCADCHTDGPQAQHKGSERRFWARAGIDPFAVAKRLYGAFLRQGGVVPAAKAGGFPKRRSKIKLATKSGFNKSVQKRKWPSRPFPRTALIAEEGEKK